MQDANVDLWATDEVHFQQHGSRCRMWIPPLSTALEATQEVVPRHDPQEAFCGPNSHLLANGRCPDAVQGQPYPGGHCKFRPPSKCTCR
jgi:hypothetical protein